MNLLKILIVLIFIFLMAVIFIFMLYKPEKSLSTAEEGIAENFKAVYFNYKYFQYFITAIFSLLFGIFFGLYKYKSIIMQKWHERRNKMLFFIVPLIFILFILLLWLYFYIGVKNDFQSLSYFNHPDIEPSIRERICQELSILGLLGIRNFYLTHTVDIFITLIIVFILAFNITYFIREKGVL